MYVINLWMSFYLLAYIRFHVCVTMKGTTLLFLVLRELQAYLVCNSLVPHNGCVAHTITGCGSLKHFSAFENQTLTNHIIVTDLSRLNERRPSTEQVRTNRVNYVRHQRYVPLCDDPPIMTEQTK